MREILKTLFSHASLASFTRETSSLSFLDCFSIKNSCVLLLVSIPMRFSCYFSSVFLCILFLPRFSLTVSLISMIPYSLFSIPYSDLAILILNIYVEHHLLNPFYTHPQFRRCPFFGLPLPCSFSFCYWGMRSLTRKSARPSVIAQVRRGGVCASGSCCQTRSRFWCEDGCEMRLEMGLNFTKTWDLAAAQPAFVTK